MKNYKSVRGVYYSPEHSPHRLVVEGFTLVFSSDAKLNSFIRKYENRVERAKRIILRFEDVAGKQEGLLEKNLKYIVMDVYREVEPLWV